MSLLRQGKTQALTIYLGESDQWQGKSVYVAIIQFLRERGCAGATATRAIAGFGAGSRLHEEAGWHWSSDAPIVIQVIDQPERLRRLLPHLQELLSGGLMTLHEVEVLKYTHAQRRGLPTNLPVRQVMQTALTTVGPNLPIAKVTTLLLDAPFRALPVVDEQGHLQGLISTGDLINAGILPGRRGLVRTALQLDSQTAETMEVPLEQAKQRDGTAEVLMNRKVRTIRPETSIREAAEVMLTTGLRRLPVVDADGRLLGMLTRADLLQVVVTSPLMSPQAASATQPLPRMKSEGLLPAQQRPIAEYMLPAEATVHEHAPLTEVIDALILSPLKRVIVIDEAEQIKGIISDVDVLAHMQAESRPQLVHLLTRWTRSSTRRPSGVLRAVGKTQTAADVMNPEVVAVTESTTAQETIEQMMATGRKVLPIRDAEGRLKGIIGRSDLLRILLEA